MVGPLLPQSLDVVIDLIEDLTIQGKGDWQIAFVVKQPEFFRLLGIDLLSGDPLLSSLISIVLVDPGVTPLRPAKVSAGADGSTRSSFLPLSA